MERVPDADSVTKSPRLSRFLLGTVAQVHLTALKECFLYLTELQEPIKYTDATGAIVLATAKRRRNDSRALWKYHHLEQSLISASGLYAAGVSVEWKNDTDNCSLLDISLNVVARGSSQGCKWYLDVDLDLIRHNNPDIQKLHSASPSPETPDMVYPESTSAQPLDSVGNSVSTSEEPGVQDNLGSDTSVDGASSSCDDCDDCCFDCSTSASPLALVYSDCYGPLPVSVGGNRYAASFIDDYSRFARIYFLKSPVDYLAAVKSFINRTEKGSESGYKLQELHSGEEGTISAQISTYLSVRGISHKTMLKSGSVARQFNHTIFTRVQSMLSDTEMEHGWWEDAAAMAVYMLNRSPNPLLDFNLPLNVWSQFHSQKGPGMAPTMFMYRPFGSKCKATLVETRGGKEIKKYLACRVLRFDAGAQEWFVLMVGGDRTFGTKDITFID